MLTAGTPAPDFSIPNAEMKMINLTDFRGQNVVLYFYPKDDTTGCTIEAIEFTDLMDDFADNNTVVFGVSRDNCVSHAAFRDKHGISVELLADVDGELCETYGVWQERESHGEKKMGILRSTFIIDKEGMLAHALYDVKPKGHAEAVLGLIEELP